MAAITEDVMKKLLANAHTKLKNELKEELKKELKEERTAELEELKKELKNERTTELTALETKLTEEIEAIRNPRAVWLRVTTATASPTPASPHLQKLAWVVKNYVFPEACTLRTGIRELLGEGIGEGIGMAHTLTGPLLKLRWYPVATDTVWQHWQSKPATHVLLLGSPGTGKTMYRNFMAAHVLTQHQEAETPCLIIMDRSGMQAKPVLIRLTWPQRGRMDVFVASPDAGDTVRAEIRRMQEIGGQVYHLLDVSFGNTESYSCLGGPQVDLNLRTMITSSPHKRMDMYTREYAKVKALVLWTPNNSVEEMIALAQLKRLPGSVRYRKQWASQLFELYGGVLRLLVENWEEPNAFDRRLFSAAKAWSLGEGLTLPSLDAFQMSDRLVKYGTTWGDKRSPNWFEPAAPYADWATPYIRHIIVKALAAVQKLRLRELAQLQGIIPGGRRGILFEDLLIELLAIGDDDHFRIRQATGERADVEATKQLLKSPPASLLRNFFTGCEEQVLDWALQRLDAGKPRILRPYAHNYAGIDAVMVFKDDDGNVHAALLQATVATTHKLTRGGLKIVKKWQQLCEAKSVTVDALVYMVPTTVFARFGPQRGVPRPGYEGHVPELVWTLPDMQAKVKVKVKALKQGGRGDAKRRRRS